MSRQLRKVANNQKYQALFIIIIIAAAGFCVATAAISQNSYGVGEGWHIYVYLDGGKAGNYEYIIPDNVNLLSQQINVGADIGGGGTETGGGTVSSVPTQVIAVTGSSLTLNPDRTGPDTYSILYGTKLITGGNGPLPQIVFTETQLYHTDHNGLSTGYSVPDASYTNNEFGDGLNWYLHYYRVAGRIRTQIQLCSDFVMRGIGGSGPPLNTYERASLNAKLYIAVRLISSNSTSEWHSNFADAKIVDVQTGTIPASPDQPTYLDTRWGISPDYSKDNQLLPFATKGSGADTTFLFQVSAQMNGGVEYNYGSFGDIANIKQQVDVYVDYTIQVGILVSQPPVVANRGAQVIGAPQDINPKATYSDIFQQIFGAIGASLAWILGVIVLIIVLWKVLPAYLLGRSARRK